MISQGGDGNFRFSSIFHRNLSISLKFPPKNYGEILIFFAVHDKIQLITYNLKTVTESDYSLRCRHSLPAFA